MLLGVHRQKDCYWMILSQPAHMDVPISTVWYNDKVMSIHATCDTYRSHGHARCPLSLVSNMNCGFVCSRIIFSNSLMNVFIYLLLLTLSKTKLRSAHTHTHIYIYTYLFIIIGKVFRHELVGTLSFEYEMDKRWNL